MDWDEIYRTDVPEASRILRRQFRQSLRRAFDPEDFVQDAVLEILRHPEIYAGVQTLVLIARRKMIDAYRRPRTEPLADTYDVDGGGPTAEQLAIAEELKVAILGAEPNPSAQHLLELRCLEFSLPEIAERTGLHLRKVQRFFQAFRFAHDASSVGRPIRYHRCPPDPTVPDPGNAGRG